MKAFVIKNKEGKYFQWLFNHEPDWEDKLYNGFMHYSKEDATKSIISWQLADCEVVEITIAEGDLEEENKQLKERIEELESQYGYECECNKDFVACQNENERLKKQLIAIKAVVLEFAC